LDKQYSNYVGVTEDLEAEAHDKRIFIDFSLLLKELQE
jgi:hypothetical protein